MLKNRILITSVLLCFVSAIILILPCTPAQAGQAGAKYVYVSDLKVKGPLPTSEYVKISNKGTLAVNLKGWKITNKTKKYQYVFPSYVLKGKSTVILYTGKGKNTSKAFYWGMSKGTWNDGGDTAYLYCSIGKLMSTLKK